jgi:predicted RNA binding protein YcfA (HicA-like mRNA interferase family)
VKTKHALRLVERAGGRLLRQRGSHRVYRLHDGRIFVVPFSGSHLELSPGLLCKLRKLGVRP